MEPLLDISLLAEFDQRVVETGAWGKTETSVSTIGSRLGPGGAPLPDEAVNWWGWRESKSNAGTDSSFGFVTLLSAADAMKRTQRMQAIDRETAGDGVPRIWRDDWLAFAALDGAHLTCDCDVAPGEPSPVRIVDFHLAHLSETPIVGSMRGVVEFWIEALDRGYLVFDRASSAWTRNEPWPGMPERMQSLLG